MPALLLFFFLPLSCAPVKLMEIIASRICRANHISANVSHQTTFRMEYCEKEIKPNQSRTGKKREIKREGKRKQGNSCCF